MPSGLAGECPCSAERGVLWLACAQQLAAALGGSSSCRDQGSSLQADGEVLAASLGGSSLCRRL